MSDETIPPPAPLQIFDQCCIPSTYKRRIWRANDDRSRKTIQPRPDFIFAIDGKSYTLGFDAIIGDLIELISPCKYCFGLRPLSCEMVRDGPPIQVYRNGRQLSPQYFVSLLTPYVSLEIRIGSDRFIATGRIFRPNIPVSFAPLKMPVEIKRLTGETVCLLLTDDSTVSEFKHCIEKRTSLGISSQQLLFRGKFLEDEKQLSDYGIQDYSVIYLQPPIRPDDSKSGGCIKRCDVCRVHDVCSSVCHCAQFANSSRKVALLVAQISGDTVTLNFNVSCTVKTFKRLIERATKVPVAEQSLSHAGKILDDSRPLSHYGIAESSTIYLTRRMLGGGKPKTCDKCGCTGSNQLGCCSVCRILCKCEVCLCPHINCIPKVKKDMEKASVGMIVNKPKELSLEKKEEAIQMYV